MNFSTGSVGIIPGLSTRTVQFTSAGWPQFIPIPLQPTPNGDPWGNIGTSNPYYVPPYNPYAPYVNPQPAPYIELYKDSSWPPLPRPEPTIDKQIDDAYKRLTPTPFGNKMPQSDPRWSKMVWTSNELWERQRSINTYSLEVDMLFSVIHECLIEKNYISIETTKQEILFVANFGQPINESTQTIIVYITSPYTVNLNMTRRVEGNNLVWCVDNGVQSTKAIRLRYNLVRSSEEEERTDKSPSRIKQRRKILV